LVVFAHGSGSSRHSPRNRFVAKYLNDRGLATLLFDLLTAEEERLDTHTTKLRFDAGLLASRLVAVVDWVAQRPQLSRTRLGLFGASTGAAAALLAAAERPGLVQAVVSRGGRPDLADTALPLVLAPTLLIVGGEDGPVIELNEWAAARMAAPHELRAIPGATHLFEEPGTLERVAELAASWFQTYLRPPQQTDAPHSAAH
jgi:putative phosphoribosyl transferase